MLSDRQAGNCLWKSVTEIGVFRATAIPSPPAGVHGELHDIGEPADLLSACRLTAWQRTKLVQVDYVRAFGFQVSVNEYFVGQLILGIVMDILIHVAVENLQGRGVDRATTAPRDFPTLNTPQFAILLPQVHL